MYYYWNKYIESSTDQQAKKAFVIDMVGLDRSLKKTIPDNKQSIEEFIRDSVKTLHSKKKTKTQNKSNKNLFFVEGGYLKNTSSVCSNEAPLLNNK